MKIAILGTENSHAYAFANLLHNDPDYRDVELVGIYGAEQEANYQIVNEGLCNNIAEKPEDYLGKVDGIMVTARHGDLHLAYALPYLRAGIPAFIDKPFTVGLEQAEQLIAVAKLSGAALCGGSVLKYPDEFNQLKRFCATNSITGGFVAAPINMVNPYGGFYFYSSHLVEMMFSVFGSDIRAVQAFCPDEATNRVSVRFDYGSFDVLALYSGSYSYVVSVCSEKGFRSATVEDLSYCFKIEMEEFLHTVRTGKMPQTYEEMKKPLVVLHAVEKSFQRGVPVVL